LNAGAAADAEVRSVSSPHDANESGLSDDTVC